MGCRIQSHRRPAPRSPRPLAHHEPSYESATAFQEPRGAFQGKRPAKAALLKICSQVGVTRLGSG